MLDGSARCVPSRLGSVVGLLPGMVLAYMALMKCARDGARIGSVSNIACLEQLLKPFLASISVITYRLSEP